MAILQKNFTGRYNSRAVTYTPLQFLRLSLWYTTPSHLAQGLRKRREEKRREEKRREEKREEKREENA
jgi:hypothetical protein